jgi:hypothetical protein
MERGLFELAWMLTRSNRVEKVQREEEVDGSACIDRKNCTTYYICVEILALGGRYGHARSIRWLSFRKTRSKTSQKKNAMRSIMRYALYFVLLGPNICIFMNICEQTEYLLSKVTLHQPFQESLATSLVFSGDLTESSQLFMKSYLLSPCPEYDISGYEQCFQNPLLAS